MLEMGKGDSHFILIFGFCSECSTDINSSNPDNNALQWVLLFIIPILWMIKLRCRGLNDTPRVTQILHGRAQRQGRQPAPETISQASSRLSTGCDIDVFKT